MIKLPKKLSFSRWGRLVLAAAFTALMFLLIFSTNTVTFLTNDDTNIMHTLAGDFTGTPYVSHPFINVVLGVAVGTLYSLAGGVSWWFIVEIFALYAGATAMTAGVIKGFHKRGLPLWIPFAVSGCLIFALYSYALIQVTFTLTAAVLGAGALALILTFGMDSRDISRPFWAITVILCLAAGTFLFRNSSGLSMLPYWGLGFLCRFLTIAGDVSDARRKSAKRLVLASAAIVAVCCALLVLINSWGIRTLNGEDYVAFEEARGRFMDYPHDTYAENPAIYKAVGWDQTLSNAVECRIYMDERVTAEALDYIVDHSSFYRLPLSVRLLKGLELGISTARQNGQLQYMLLPLLMIFAIACLGFFRRKQGHALHFAVCLLYAAGGFALSLLLCCSGRFLLRTFQLLAYPTAVGMLLSLLPLIEPRCALSAELTRRGRVTNLCVTVLAFALTALCIADTARALKNVDARQTVRLSRTLTSYVLEHPSNIYIRTTTAGYDIDPLIRYAEKPTNLFDCGGTSMHTGYMKKQLERNDLSDFTPSVFRRDDVYFVSFTGDLRTQVFEQYMIETEGALGLTEVEILANCIGVYRVDFPNEE